MWSPWQFVRTGLGRPSPRNCRLGRRPLACVSRARGGCTQLQLVAGTTLINEVVSDFRKQWVLQDWPGRDSVVDARLAQVRASGDAVRLDNAALDVVASRVLHIQGARWSAAPQLHNVPSNLRLRVTGPAGACDREAEIGCARV